MRRAAWFVPWFTYGRSPRPLEDDDLRGALTRRGMIAPFVPPGAINPDAFEAQVGKVPVPELRPGDVVVMDSLSSRKGPRTHAPIEARGAALPFRPPYSPDFNPIENAFAKLNSLLRRAAERTVEDRWAPLWAPIRSPTPSPRPDAPTPSAPADTIQTGRLPLWLPGTSSCSHVIGGRHAAGMMAALPNPSHPIAAAKPDFSALVFLCHKAAFTRSPFRGGDDSPSNQRRGSTMTSG
ncbi:hypothetical protein E4O86_02275 [Rhizobiales bacterium L72]|uniref:Tc1-like transposase DDE domain-containing protein n=1 Tax=Propylenella binzhouense TaxID=2555902 RepID=A0A964WS33_9HYPH|nr:hypothetical protein [Propylenella binzhouense]